MKQENYVAIINEMTKRALWEVKNIIDCIPDELWQKCYCAMPMWKHIYHMLHSLDVWYINPSDLEYKEPIFHEKDLNNLDVVSKKSLTREQINQYYVQITAKINKYLDKLEDTDLLEYPSNCEYTKFTLILGQFRHLHSHMGIIMGFIIEDTGKWPMVLGLTYDVPKEDKPRYF